MHSSTTPLHTLPTARRARPQPGRALLYDLVYGLIGLIIVAAISVRYGDPAAALAIGALMLLCYLAGGVRYRSH